MTDATTPLHYRRAQLADLEAVSVLFDLYRGFYRQSTDVAGATHFIGDRLQAQDSCIFVAERDGALLGFTQLYPSFSSVSMQRSWILNDLFVVEHARQQGIGYGLLSAARAFALADKAKGLILATEINNTSAQALYESFGFKKDTTFFHYYYYF